MNEHELFSDAWMKALMEEWNGAPEVSDALAKIDFDAVITCGFKNEDNPRGIFVVEKGVCVRAGAWTENDPDPSWDMRADIKHWKGWVAKGIGMAGLGTAYMTGKLKFLVGDYGAMIKNPAMATPFVKSFGLMQNIGCSENA